MAHCDQRLSDQVGIAVPESAELVSVDPNTPGGAGLGCSSNTRIAACTYASNLIVYDAEGTRLWDATGLLGPSAGKSAAIVGPDDTVVAADSDRVMRVDPQAGRVMWSGRKRDRGEPISPVLVGDAGDYMVFIATWSAWSGPSTPGTAEVSVWDLRSGRRLSSAPVVDESTGKLYVTRNTPSVNGSRAYVTMGASGDLADGRLYALDVCNASQCGGRGRVSVAWYLPFRGGSGASPTLIGNRIYFDGRESNSVGTFMAVEDTGAQPVLAWSREFSGLFYASAAVDSRGGVWVATAPATTLMRLDEDTGATLQTVSVGDVLGLEPGYAVGSVLTGGYSAEGEMALTFGAFFPGRSEMPTYLAAVDVGSSPEGSALWRYNVAPSFVQNAAAGQFPILVNQAGARRMPIVGKTSSTFFIGEP
jgi:hypothetical protein